MSRIKKLETRSTRTWLRSALAQGGLWAFSERFSNTFLFGGRVSVVFHAQGVDLVADAPFDARLRFAQRLLRAGSVRRAPRSVQRLLRAGSEGGHVR
jgi:hypothetical protein